MKTSRPALLSALALTALVIATGGFTSGATATERLATSAGGSTAASGSRPVYVVAIHGPGVVHQADGTAFYPTGKLAAGTIMVIPNEDGTLPGGMSISEIARRANSSTTMAAASSCLGGTYLTTLNTWTSVQTATNCVVIGSSTGTVSYWFGIAPGTNGSALGQGLGYYQGYNGSTFGIWAKWYGLGMASDGLPGGATLPWVNVAANPKFMAMGMSIVPAMGNWGV